MVLVSLNLFQLSSGIERSDFQAQVQLLNCLIVRWLEEICPVLCLTI